MKLTVTKIAIQEHPSFGAGKYIRLKKLLLRPGKMPGSAAISLDPRPELVTYGFVLLQIDLRSKQKTSEKPGCNGKNQGNSDPDYGSFV